MLAKAGTEPLATLCLSLVRPIYGFAACRQGLDFFVKGETLQTGMLQPSEENGIGIIALFDLARLHTSFRAGRPCVKMVQFAILATAIPGQAWIAMPALWHRFEEDAPSLRLLMSC